MRMARRKTPASARSELPRHELDLPAPKPLRVLVAGEVILDRYIWGDVSRISPEAPIPILRVQRREEKPGNAGFVMANLRALGANVSAVSVVGADRNGRLLREIFADLGIATRSILTDPDRPTIVKDRMLGSVQAAHRATQQLLRVDEEDPSVLKPARERELISRLKSELRECDGVLVSDIDKGMLTPAVLRALIEGGRARGIPVIVDPRRSEDFSIYRGATALTPNRHETEVATGTRLTDRDGMYLAERGGRDTYVPTAPREVYDVTGAGDVVLSVFGMFTIAGLGFSSAATIANLAASIEVTRIGTEVITREDLARALAPGHDTYERKIHSVDELKAALGRERRAGRRIAFTNGCFDLLHAGHIQILAFARAQADLLVVGLNSDRSVHALKGDSRPIYPAAERARILAALEAVDYVVVFDETRAEKIIRTIKPDVLIKGEDWRGKRVDGQAFVEARGGRLALAPLLGGRSTSATIDRMSSGKISRQSPRTSVGKNGARSDR